MDAAQGAWGQASSSSALGGPAADAHREEQGGARLVKEEADGGAPVVRYAAARITAGGLR
jgi:hypothetical protein